MIPPGEKKKTRNTGIKDETQAFATFAMCDSPTPSQGIKKKKTETITKTKTKNKTKQKKKNPNSLLLPRKKLV